MAKKADLEPQDRFKTIFDESKQRIVGKGLIEDVKLFAQLHPYIDVNVFSELNMRLLMGEVKDYYVKNKVVPSYDIVESTMLYKAKSEIEIEEIKALIKELREEKPVANVVAFKQIAINFFKQQSSVKLVNKYIKKLQTGYKDADIAELIEEAKKISMPSDTAIGYSPADVMNDIFESEDEEKVPTGYFELDAMLGGGLQKGNVGLLVAQTGAGKTTFSTAMATQAAMLGKKVLHLIFEESEKDIVKKIFACMTKERISNMTKAHLSERTKQEIREKVPIINNNIVIKRLENTKTTWEEIESYIYNLTMSKNFVPDVIFVDYFDCLKHSTDTRLSLTDAAVRCIKKIDNFAKNKKVAIWVMQQMNRNGAKSNNPDDPSFNIQGSYAITQTTAVNTFLTKSEEENRTNRATLIIKKNRQGFQTTIKSFYFDNSNLQIDLSTAEKDENLELVISEFTKNNSLWQDKHNSLQMQYLNSQQQAPTSSATIPTQQGQIINNVHHKPSGETFSSTIKDPRDWPDNF